MNTCPTCDAATKQYIEERTKPPDSFMARGWDGNVVGEAVVKADVSTRSVTEQGRAQLESRRMPRAGPSTGPTDQMPPIALRKYLSAFLTGVCRPSQSTKQYIPISPFAFGAFSYPQLSTSCRLQTPRYRHSHFSPSPQSHMFKVQILRRSLSLFRRVPHSDLVRAAARGGHGSIQVQRVRFKKPFFTRS